MTKIAVVRFMRSQVPSSDEEDPYARKSAFAKKSDGPGSEKKYEYLVPVEIGVPVVGGFAVVCVSNEGVSWSSLRIAKIYEVRDPASQHYEGDLKPVVAVLSGDLYEAWTKRLAEKKAILVQIEKKVSERSKISQLELLAGNDPEAQELLRRFNEISGTPK